MRLYFVVLMHIKFLTMKKFYLRYMLHIHVQALLTLPYQFLDWKATIYDEDQFIHSWMKLDQLFLFSLFFFP